MIFLLIFLYIIHIKVSANSDAITSKGTTWVDHFSSGKSAIIVALIETIFLLFWELIKNKVSWDLVPFFILLLSIRWILSDIFRNLDLRFPFNYLPELTEHTAMTDRIILSLPNPKWSQYILKIFLIGMSITLFIVF